MTTTDGAVDRSRRFAAGDLTARMRQAVPVLAAATVIGLPLGRLGQFRLAGFPFSLLKVVSLALVMCLLVNLRASDELRFGALRRWYRAQGLGVRSGAVAVALLAMGLALRPDALLSEPVAFLQLASSLLLVPVVALSWRRVPVDWRPIVAVLVGIMALCGALVTIGDSVVLNFEGSKTTRLAGTLGDPNDWAGVLLSVGGILWAYGSRADARWVRRARIIAAVGVGGALVSTQSRGGLVALLVILIVYGLVGSTAGHRRITIVALVGTACLFVGLRAADGGPLPESVAVQRILLLERGEDNEVVDGTSVTTRFKLIEIAAESFAEAPLTGHGAGSYFDVASYQRSPTKTVGAHNSIAVAAVEHGILGLAGSILLIVPGLWAAARSTSPTARRLGATLLGLWVMGLTVDLLDNSYLWMILALVLVEASAPAQARTVRGPTPVGS